MCVCVVSRQGYTPLHPLLSLSLTIPPSFSLLPGLYLIISSLPRPFFLSLSSQLIETPCFSQGCLIRSAAAFFFFFFYDLLSSIKSQLSVFGEADRAKNRRIKRKKMCLPCILRADICTVQCSLSLSFPVFHFHTVSLDHCYALCDAAAL